MARSISCPSDLWFFIAAQLKASGTRFKFTDARNFFSFIQFWVIQANIAALSHSLLLCIFAQEMLYILPMLQKRIFVFLRPYGGLTHVA